MTALITDCELTKASGEAGSDPVVGAAMIARDRYHQTPAQDQGGGADGSQARVVSASVTDGPAPADEAADDQCDAETVAAPHDAAATADRRRNDVDAGTEGQGTGLQVYADSAYGTGEARAAYRAGGHDTVIKPKPLCPAVEGGFTLDDFTINEQDGTVTCPGGHTRVMSPKRTVTFGKICADCPLRSRCTTAQDGRSMTIHPHQDLLRAARAQARTPQFKQDYPTRSMIERIIAWTATCNGQRVKLRYLGVAKNHAWLRTRCAAINLRTLVNNGLTRHNGAWALA